MPAIHHVTAVASDPQHNLDFYTGVLGLRLVKVTVNFDEPETYHLYYGDGRGRPGTLLTFFCWPGAHRGRTGTGQIRTVALSVPERASEFWVRRLRMHGVLFEVSARFGDEVISFSDPDRLRLELIANRDGREPWGGGPVPAEQAIRGIFGITLAEEDLSRTAALLSAAMGFRKTGESGVRCRFAGGDDSAGTIVDVESLPDLRPARIGAGSVHHAAYRAADEGRQLEWREQLAHEGLEVTPVTDRRYFHSIYFREPGGTLFEIATDGPGFEMDEAAGVLGTSLMLPPWLESQRQRLEQILPPLRLPMRAQTA
jgi:glyoxalase family protein